MHSPAAVRTVSPLRATIAALAASLVGVGLARFGYTPLIPVLIAAGWFSPAAAVYLGAANLAGYLAGALAAGRIAPRAGTAATLRGAMALTAASLVACAFPLGFAWFFPWRFLSGVTGGVLMALAAPTAMAAIPPARRGIAGGAIFTGVGLGIAASGTLVPLLARVGLTETWLGLGALALALTAIAWGGWPASPPRAPAPLRSSSGKRAGSPMLLALYLEYALNAVGLVPHMIFLVDFIARGLGRGVAAGGHYWVLFGIGALIGPMLAGHLGDRIGFRAALRLAFVIEAAAVAAPLVSVGAPSLELSTFVVGAFVPGIVAITIGRARELVGLDPAAYVAAWGRCTIAFAIGQAAAGYGFSYIFARVEHGYPVLFAIAAAALLAALAVDVAVAGALRRATRPHRAVGG